MRGRLLSQRGLTLLELMVTMSIMVIMGALMLPQVPEIQESFDRLNAQSNLLQDIKRAQAQAITEGCRGVIKIAADQRSYSSGCDYLNYDADIPPTPDIVAFVRHLPPNISIQVSQPVIFNSRGQTIDTDYIITTTTLTLIETSSGGAIKTGTLLGTGVLAYD